MHCGIKLAEKLAADKWITEEQRDVIIKAKNKLPILKEEKLRLEEALKTVANYKRRKSIYINNNIPPVPTKTKQ
jgi:hypothetical protein